MIDLVADLRPRWGLLEFQADKETHVPNHSLDRFALTSAVLALASKVFDAHVSPDSQISALDRTARLFG